MSFDGVNFSGAQAAVGDAATSGGIADEGAEEAALLARYAEGDQAAARVLTERLTPRALAVATRMLGDAAEAEDVAQEAMLRLWRIAPEWREGEAKVSTWLHRVVSNLCIDRLRRRKRDGPPLDETPERPDPTASAEARLAAQGVAASLMAAIGDLPERQRVAVTLRHFEDLGNPEIGEILGVSVEAVESLLARGRRTLAKRMARGGAAASGGA